MAEMSEAEVGGSDRRRDPILPWLIAIMLCGVATIFVLVWRMKPATEVQQGNASSNQMSSDTQTVPPPPAGIDDHEGYDGRAWGSTDRDGLYLTSRSLR